MHPDTAPLPLDAVRVRFALDDVDARRLARSLRSGTPAAGRLITPLRPAHSGACDALALVAGGPALGTEVTVQARPVRWSQLRDVQARAVGVVPRIVEERHLGERRLSAELSHHWAGPAAPRVLLSPAQSELVRRCLHPAPEPLAWITGPPFEQYISWTTVAGLPVAVQRWSCQYTGMDATELQAEVDPAQGDLAVLVVAAHLRRLGVDTGFPQPWLEQRLRFGPGS